MAPNPTLRDHKLLILLPIDVPASYLAFLAAAFPDLTVTCRSQSWLSNTPPVPESAWSDITLLLSYNTFPLPSQAPRLQCVQLQSAGAEHVLTHPLFLSPSVQFCTANGVHGPQISEWIITTYLASTHQLPRFLSQQTKEEWDRGDLTTFDDAAQKTIGILGYGAIGRQTARVAVALGMRVHAYTLHPRETPESKREKSWAPPGMGDPQGEFPSAWFSGGTKADIHAFLASGLDLLVIATPLTDGTRHLLSHEEFAVLAGVEKGKTFVSNVARGPVVDTDALMEALEKDWIKGAAVDVTDPEPLPEGHPLWKAKNLIITPHVSGASKAYVERVLAILKENLGRFSREEGLMNLVDKKRGY